MPVDLQGCQFRYDAGGEPSAASSLIVQQRVQVNFELYKIVPVGRDQIGDARKLPHEGERFDP
jgi:hypothetical protein